MPDEPIEHDDATEGALAFIFSYVEPEEQPMLERLTDTQRAAVLAMTDGPGEGWDAMQSSTKGAIFRAADALRGLILGRSYNLDRLLPVDVKLVRKGRGFIVDTEPQMEIQPTGAGFIVRDISSDDPELHRLIARTDDIDEAAVAIRQNIDRSIEVEREHWYEGLANRLRSGEVQGPGPMPYPGTAKPAHPRGEKDERVREVASRLVEPTNGARQALDGIGATLPQQFNVGDLVVAGRVYGCIDSMDGTFANLIGGLHPECRRLDELTLIAQARQVLRAGVDGLMPLIDQHFAKVGRSVPCNPFPTLEWPRHLIREKAEFYLEQLTAEPPVTDRKELQAACAKRFGCAASTARTQLGRLISVGWAESSRGAPVTITKTGRRVAEFCARGDEIPTASPTSRIDAVVSMLEAGWVGRYDNVEEFHACLLAAAKGAS